MNAIQITRINYFRSGIWSTLVLVLGLSLTACGGGEKTADTPEAKQERLTQLKAQLISIQDEIKTLETDLRSGSGAPAGKSAKVKTGQVTAGVFTHYIEVQGKVDSEQNILISPKAAGSIVKVYVKKGDQVKSGQLLVQIDDEIIRKSMDEVKTQLDLATVVYNRQKNLWDQKIGTEMQFLTAKANKEALEKRMITLEDQQDMAKVKAPFSGIVDEVIAKEGESAMPGMPLLRLVNPSNNKIVAEFSEAYFTRVSPGNEVLVYFPDQQLEGKSSVRVKSNSINMVNRTFMVEMPSPALSNLIIRPNMVVEVRVKDYEAKAALAIPLNLIQRDENQEFVYVSVRDGDQNKASRRLIKTGMAYRDKVEITEGLNEGDELVLVGYQNLVDGQPLEIIQ
jgi:RND family efflux transporter MFP subunit